MNAQTVNDILGHVSTGAFTALGLLSLRFWLQRRDRPSLWAALCFGTLTAVVLAGEVLPEDANTGLEEVGLRLLVVVLLLFPYLLFRFAAAFESASRRVEWLIGASTVALSAWTLALPDFPQEGEPRSTGFDVYLGALALYWGALSLFVAVKLWRAGRDQPNVARRRMRLLSFAATLLTVAILLAVGNPEGTSWLALTTSILGHRERSHLRPRPGPARDPSAPVAPARDGEDAPGNRRAHRCDDAGAGDERGPARDGGAGRRPSRLPARRGGRGARESRRVRRRRSGR